MDSKHFAKEFVEESVLLAEERAKEAAVKLSAEAAAAEEAEAT